MHLSWKGVDLFLLPDRAVLLKKSRTLLVADLHLGKDEVFRTSGIPVPQGPAERTLERLSRVLDETKPERLVILGDLFHAAKGNTKRVYDPLAALREKHSALQLILVRGNHDRFNADWKIKLNIEVVDSLDLDGLSLNHAMSLNGTAVMCAHIHPAVRVKMRNGPRSLLPCFYFTDSTCILPAFGDFTGHGILPTKGASRVFVIAGNRVLEIPRGARNKE